MNLITVVLPLFLGYVFVDARKQVPGLSFEKFEQSLERNELQFLQYSVKVSSLGVCFYYTTRFLIIRHAGFPTEIDKFSFHLCIKNSNWKHSNTQRYLNLNPELNILIPPKKPKSRFLFVCFGFNSSYQFPKEYVTLVYHLNFIYRSMVCLL